MKYEVYHKHFPYNYASSFYLVLRKKHWWNKWEVIEHFNYNEKEEVKVYIEWIGRFFELLTKLPHLTGNGQIVSDLKYAPSLYHFDNKWCLSWIHCEDCEHLLDYYADTPEKAIVKAYTHYTESIKFLNHKDE